MKHRRLMIGIAALLLLSCSLLSCAVMTKRQGKYVPRGQWVGEETRVYDDAVSEVWVYVSLHPTGSPDPQPQTPESKEEFDPVHIDCRTDQAKYSLSQTKKIPVHITYSESLTGAEGNDTVLIHRNLNLERWDGEAWQRTIYVNPDVYMMKIQMNHLVQAGETVTKKLLLENVYTKLTPGKYRLVAYVNYQPVYAEFELTE